MPILNFKKEFAELVATGKKRQTIRATRKRPIAVGDRLYLYTGLRTKEAKNLVELNIYLDRDNTIADSHLARSMRGNMVTVYDRYTICKEVHDIEMEIDVRCFGNGTYEHLTIYIDGKSIDYIGMEVILIADGFKNLRDMQSWFKTTHGFPFKGQLIKW